MTSEQQKAIDLYQSKINLLKAMTEIEREKIALGEYKSDENIIELVQRKISALDSAVEAMECILEINSAITSGGLSPDLGNLNN